MMRNTKQDQPLQVTGPIPDAVLPQAGRLWWRHFGAFRAARGFHAEQGAVALQGGQLQGVIGFRDSDGGFAIWPRIPLAFLFRPCPPTADLVIDGIVALTPHRGVGRALIARAEAEARLRGRSGLRAEVAARNHAAVGFYRRLGFVEEARGRYGWPWTGAVLVLRKPLAGLPSAEHARRAAQQHESTG